MTNKIGIGLYGTNGHQVHEKLVNDPLGVCVAVAAFDQAMLPDELRSDPNIRHYPTLEDLLQDKAIRCLEAGKHAYAEKPCAMTEEDLDAIIAAAQRTGRQFHEMAGTAFAQPYLAIRRLVQSGVLGTIVQVLVQKSYPYHDRRPQDEDVDGGMLMQAGVHATRFIEHVTGLKIVSIQAIETRLGNPKPGNLRMASSVMASLENGAVASIVVNYLNMLPFGQWGNETLRIFGTQGFVEAVDGGTRTRLVLKDEDRGPLSLDEPSQDYLDFFMKSLHGQDEMPLSLEDELHPTRMVIRAKRDAVMWS
jgi:predicted dehydrogenase